MTLREGETFADRYRVIRRLGSGGMGVVYEVEILRSGRRGALKVMLPHILQSPELCERFQRETRLASQVESEFIVEVHDAGVDDATAMPFMVMELLVGEDLQRRLDRLTRLSTDEVVTHLHHAAIALDRTHRASIVHRDLKPENLFLADRADGPPRIKLLDFGIAKMVAEHGGPQTFTQCIGTPLYMAPEQLDTRARLTGAVDIYALGLIAYTLLVGKAYWLAESLRPNLLALASAVARGPEERATARAARAGVSLPGPFDGWFAKITAPSPGDRFSSATRAIEALAASLAMSDRSIAPSMPTAPAAPIAAPPRRSIATAPSPKPSRPAAMVADATLPVAGRPR